MCGFSTAQALALAFFWCFGGFAAGAIFGKLRTEAQIRELGEDE